jgi:hypothetical protein
MDEQDVITAVRRWVDTFVIGMNLCPFARAEVLNDRVRFVVTQAAVQAELVQALHAEVLRLEDDPSIETTLLIHPHICRHFDDYNQFLDVADALLAEMGADGVYQVASFHPDYQFAGTNPEDAENYTNRSPFPMLHILRESSLDRALEAVPDAARIPQRNIEYMQRQGRAKLQALLDALCAP